MRIVGGKFRGKTLSAPPRGDLSIRPTSDALRESVFNILAHWPEREVIEGARVLDLFAGTGALGLEALSRGAAFTLFIEQAAEARALIRANIEALQATGTSKLFRRDATKLGDADTLGKFSLIFADPPYGKGLGEAALSSALAGGWIAPEAMIVVEEAKASGFTPPDGFELLQRRAYGDSEVVFLAVSAAAE